MKNKTRTTFFFNLLVITSVVFIIGCQEGKCTQEVSVQAGGTVVWTDVNGQSQTQYTDQDFNGTVSVPCGGTIQNV